MTPPPAQTVGARPGYSPWSPPRSCSQGGSDVAGALLMRVLAEAGESLPLELREAVTEYLMEAQEGEEQC